VDLPLRLDQQRTRRIPGLIDTLKEEEAAEPTLPRPEISTKYTPPETGIQQTLAKIWQGFLGIQQVGIHDDLFELGADSLKAITVIARIHKELNTEVSITDMFTYPTIAQLAGYIQSAKESLYSSIAPVEEKEYYPLSSAQKRLYYLQQMHKKCVFYNLPMIFIVEGQLRKDHPGKAFRELIRRHESLRTSFQLVDEEPVQRIHDEVEFQVEYDEEGTRGLAPLPIEPTETLISSFIRPFDLSQAPLLRLEILQIDKEKYLWLFDIHHIVIDATGCAVLHNQLERLYNNKELPAVKVRYKDFSQWQNHLLTSGRIKTQQDYWLKVYPDEVPELKLPSDYPRPQESTFAGDRHYFRLSETETSKFLDLGSSVGATLFIDALAVLNVLLFKYTGQRDIVIGSSIAGRPHADLQDIVGMFVNMLAMRNFPGENMTYLELLKNVKTNSLKAFENQDLQFEMLVEQLNIKTGSSGNPFFNICLNVENYEHITLNIKGLTFTHYPYEPDTSKFDMLLWANPMGKEIHFMLEYSTELFKPSTAEEFSNHFVEIIRQVIGNKDIPLKDIKISHKVLIPGSEVPEIDFGF
jgi:tyrocidine synthetase-3